MNSVRCKVKKMLKVVLPTTLVVLLSLTTLTALGVQEVYAKDLSKAEITCVTRNAYFEARNQGEKGILATVFVVLNRTKDSRFPSTPCRVVAQPYQFEWYGKGKVVKDHKTYQEIEVLVREVLSGKHRDFTRGSTHFHHVKIKPDWSKRLTPTVQVGVHKFYK